MKQATHRRLGELTRKLFEILIAEPSGLPRGEALARLEAAVTLTPHEAGVYKSTGKRRFEQLISFATSTCVQAGWMQKRSGFWWITEAGTEAWREFMDAAEFASQALRLRNAHLAKLRTDLALPSEAVAAGQRFAASAGATAGMPRSDVGDFAAAQASAWQEIERHVLALGSYTFQSLVADLMRAMGWHVTFVAPPGPDGGVDIVALRDPLGTVTPRLKVQVKHGESKIGPAVLRAFTALLRNGEAGLFAATGGFTREAEEFARLHTDRLTLLDLPRFVELWAEHEARLDVRARSRLPLTRVLFLAPTVSAASTIMKALEDPHPVR